VPDQPQEHWPALPGDGAARDGAPRVCLTQTKGELVKRVLQGLPAVCGAVCALALAPTPCRAEGQASAFFAAHRIATAALASAEAPDGAGPEASAAEKAAGEAARAYEAFIKAYPESPEASLARVLRGIVLWRDCKNMAAAEQEFAAAAQAPGEDVVSAHAARLGKRWLARVRMTRIARACHAFYIDEVEYPEKLDELVERKLLDPADMTDPWGARFEYEATEHPLLRDVPRQAYRLRSKHMPGEEGDPEKTAGLLEGEREFVRKVVLKGTTAGSVMVRLGDESLVIELGRTRDGLAAVLISSGGAVLCSNDYVVVASR